MNNTVKQVKDQWDIVDEVRKVVQLSKRGQNFVGLCPFHSEKTPSFYVSPSKKIFNCFGCGENGDVISFVMKHYHLSFKEVVAEKATELNIPHQFSADSTFNTDVDQLREFLNSLQIKYTEWLSQNPAAEKYLLDRGMGASVLHSFGLGFAPKASAQKQWFMSGDMLPVAAKSGLFKDDGYPLLQDRVIYPIHNARGIIVGFSGRVLGSSDTAKYINSPESVIFSKKKILYATHFAKADIKKLDSVIVVEGYMDVIAMHQHGIKNVVGVMGTALTDAHASEITRYTKNVTLMFDSDKAGQAAAIKSIEPLLNHQLSIKIATLNEKDPADYLSVYSAKELQLLVEGSPFYMAYFIDLYKKSGALDDLSKKSQAVNFLCDLLAKEKNKVIKDQLTKDIASEFDVSLNIVESYSRPKVKNQPREKVSITTNSKYKKAEEILAYLMVTNKEFRLNNIDDLKDYLPILSDKSVLKTFKTADLVDYDLINEISHSEIKSFLLSLIIKFTELNLLFTTKEMEEYTTILKQTKVNERIEEIRSLLGKAQGNQEKQLLVELSDLIKKIK